MNNYLLNPIALAAKFATFNPGQVLAQIERGDSDTSASTIRTAGAVGLVVVVVLAIITAVATLGQTTATTIGGVTWPNTVP